MKTQTAAPTLYEDWQTRRRHLALSAAPTGQAYVEVQVHVIDFLLKRYLGAPEASEQARFPLSAALPYFNQRAIVVHHHLAAGKASTVKNETDARTRLSRILKRIADVDPQSSLGVAFKAGAGTSYEVEPYGRSREETVSEEQLYEWSVIGEFIVFGATPEVICARIEEALAHGSRLPEHATFYLFEMVWNQMKVWQNGLELLLRCENDTVSEYAIMLWARAQESPDSYQPLISRLTDYFRAHPGIADFVRNQLASKNGATRLGAITLLPIVGSLQDVGLLLDLLALPPQSDEHPREREALTETLKKLAGLSEPQRPA